MVLANTIIICFTVICSIVLIAHETVTVVQKILNTRHTLALEVQAGKQRELETVKTLYEEQEKLEKKLEPISSIFVALDEAFEE